MNLEATLTSFHTAVMLIVFVGMIRIISNGRRTMCAVFFSFAVASLLLSDFYWLAYDILRPGTRMPFAANEIGEWAMFLLLGASLTSLRSINFHQARLEVLCTVLFITASTALWISWSGEWVDDIVTGIVYGYFLCCLVALMKQEEMVPSYKWGMLGGVSLLLIAGQVVIFFVPDDMKRAIDLFCYGLMFLVELPFILRAMLTLKNTEMPARKICRCYVALAWSVSVMYMSTGGVYIVAMIATTLCFPLTLMAMKKEVEAG